MAEFDVKRVTPLEWAGVGAGALAFLVSFFPWYSTDIAGDGGSASAWNTGIGAWLPVLMLMVVGGLVLGTHFGLKVARLPLIWLSVAAAAAVIILLRWLTLPDDGGFGGLGGLGIETGIDSGAGFGLVIGLLAAIVSGAAAFFVYRASTKTATA
jgi:hypothetical protein